MLAKLIFFLSIFWSVSAQDVLDECPADWFDAGSLGCFRFLEGRVNLTWVEAQLACEQSGGFLAEPTSQTQIEFLSELAILEGSFTGIGFWYIGLTDLGREGDWMWMHGKYDLDDNLWKENRPNNKSRNSDDCVVMVLRSNEVYWEDHSCLAPDVSHHEVAPVCQVNTLASQPTTTTTTQPTTTAVSCPGQWTEFEGSCYRHFADREYYWTTADALCLSEGARLTSIHSEAENDFLNSLAGGNSYWIGGYPRDSSWVWSDFSEYDYKHLYVTSQGECLYQSRSYYESGWTSTSCSSSSLYYTCKLMK